jgi:predicted amidophosphoribosyltransferase
MGDRACYLELCPECDAQLTVVDERCPDCGAPLPDPE